MLKMVIEKMDVKKKISMDEFFKILEITSREWKFRAGTREEKIELITPDLTEGRTIYLQDPLTAVATKLSDCHYSNGGSDWDWYKAGKDIGFSHENTMAIFRATNKLEGYDLELRRKILKATGLL